MKLLIDLGNTRAKYQLLNESDQLYTAIQYNEFTEQYFEEHWHNVTQVFIAAVANIDKVNKVAKWANKNSILFTQIFTEAKRFGITAGYLNHQQLGVDRWLALIGASVLYPHKNILIVDAGTATTIDFLTAQGLHYGGWIIPGYEVMKNSLLRNTANIRIQDDESEKLLPGKSTSENVHNGCWLAMSGAINQALIEIEKQNVIVELILFTGGNGESLKNLINKPAIVNSLLIFKGIEQYAKQQNLI